MATRNIVPRNHEEGQLGTTLKNWLKGWFKDLFVSGEITDGNSGVAVTVLNLDDAVDKKHSSDLLGTKILDESAIGDGKVPVYRSSSGKIEYETPSGVGDMLKSVYDTGDNGIVDNSEKLEGSTKAQVQDHNPKAHTHLEVDITDLDHYDSSDFTIDFATEDLANLATKSYNDLTNKPDLTDLHSHTNKTELDLVTDGDHDVRIDNPHLVTVDQLDLASGTVAFDIDDAISKAHTQNTDTDFIRKDGTVPLLADWDIGGARKILASLIAARDVMGLRLFDYTTGRGIYIADGGNVGIGSEADEKTHIAKSVDGSAVLLLLENSQENINGSVNETAEIRFGFGGDNDVARILVGKENDYQGAPGENDSFIAFYTDLDGVASERIRIDSNGRVGIGNDNPSSRLTVGSPHVTAGANNDATVVNKIGAYTTAGLGVTIGHVDGDDGSIYAYDYVAWTGKNLIINEFGGNVGIGDITPTALLDINSDILRLRTSKTPSSVSDTGNAGDICWDSNYIYICVATDTWKRSAITTW